MATKSIPTIAEVKAIIEDELSKLNLGGDIDLGAIAESIIPAISASYNLGSSTKKFNNAYANHFYQNGQHCLSLDSICVNGAYSNTSSYVTINTGGLEI